MIAASAPEKGPDSPVVDCDRETVEAPSLNPPAARSLDRGSFC